MTISLIFQGVPNGNFNSINELFNKNPTLLLKHIEADFYKIIAFSDIPNDCLIRLRELSLNSNNYAIHTNIKTINNDKK